MGCGNSKDDQVMEDEENENQRNMNNMKNNRKTKKIKNVKIKITEDPENKEKNFI